MQEHEIDIELLRNNKLTEKELRASVLEDLLKELKIKFSRQYALLDDRSIRTTERTYTADDDITIIYMVKCTESLYNFTLYLFKNKIDKLEKIIQSYEY